MDLKDEFYQLRDQWFAERNECSCCAEEIVDTPAYRKIIELGESVVPYIIAELVTDEPDFWFAALHRITGYFPPIARDEAGRVTILAEKWLDWYEEIYLRSEKRDLI